MSTGLAVFEVVKILGHSMGENLFFLYIVLNKCSAVLDVLIVQLNFTECWEDEVQSANKRADFKH